MTARTVTSTFDKSAQGWTLAGDVQSSGWEKSGGDPGGYLSWVDAATGQDSYYQAPKAFLDSKGGYYGGTLSYAILDTGNNYTAYDVQLVGDGHTLQYTNPNDASFPTPNVWSEASVTLVPSNFIDIATSRAPTKSEMKAVLRDLTALDIRAEYVNGAESGGLDTVTLTPATPGAAGSPASPASAMHDVHHAAASGLDTILSHIA